MKTEFSNLIMPSCILYSTNISKNFENPNPERNRENLRKKDIKIPNAFGNAIKYRKLRGKNRSKMIKKTETAQM